MPRLKKGQKPMGVLIVTCDDRTKERLKLAAEHFGLSMSCLTRLLINSHLPDNTTLRERIEKFPTGVSWMPDMEPKEPPDNIKVDRKEPVNIDWESVKKWWNQEVRILLSKPKITQLSITRKAKVKRRILEDPDILDKIKEEAHFVGRFFMESNSWGGFDWLFKSKSNADKFLEGHYRARISKDTPEVPAVWSVPSWFPKDWRQNASFRKKALELGCKPKQLEEGE